MRVLLTGHRGLIGSGLADRLAELGSEVVGFDALSGDDIRDADAVERRARGCEVVIHAAGVPDDPHTDAGELIKTNLLGTYNALRAADRAKARRVIFFSSGKALGLLERDPAYLPVDDQHPGRPWRPYGLAKWLGEEMCEAFSRTTGASTICLRPVAVFTELEYAQARSTGERPAPAGEVWNLGVFVDLRDVVRAAVSAVECPLDGHARVLLCATDIASARATLELVDERLDGVIWRDGDVGRAQFASQPRRALVDGSGAQRTLGWTPVHTWRSEVLAPTDK